MGQLSPHAATTEACVLQQEKPPQWEAHASQLGKDCAVTKIQGIHTSSINLKLLKGIIPQEGAERVK